MDRMEYEFVLALYSKRLTIAYTLDVIRTKIRTNYYENVQVKGRLNLASRCMLLQKSTTILHVISIELTKIPQLNLELLQ